MKSKAPPLAPRSTLSSRFVGNAPTFALSSIRSFLIIALVPHIFAFSAFFALFALFAQKMTAMILHVFHISLHIFNIFNIFGIFDIFRYSPQAVKLRRPNNAHIFGSFFGYLLAAHSPDD